MVFVNSDYLEYDNIVEISDNYICLAKTNSVNGSWESPKTIDVIYQYITPSIYTIESTRTFSNSQTFESIEVTDNFYNRADCNQIVLSQFLVIFLCIFVLNGLTRFVRKGGIFFGS